MRVIQGKIELSGPFIDVKVMATHFRVTTLKNMGASYPAPIEIRALIDTGASGSVLDPVIVSRLGLTLVGQISVHTPTTGSEYETRNQFDASILIIDTTLPPNQGTESFTVGVIESALASEGFLAIIGWDILKKCILTCDGPAGKFRLEF